MARSSTRGSPRRLISPGFIRRGTPLQFFQETVGELRKAVWPTREEIVRLTWIVILLAVAAGFVLSGLDEVLRQTFVRFIIRG